MLILLSLIDPKHRRKRDAWLLGIVCAVCLARLAALHAPHETLIAPATASAWSHDGPPQSAVAVVALNHARFMPQEASIEGSASTASLPRPSTVSMGFAAEAMAEGAPFGFPYATR